MRLHTSIPLDLHKAFPRYVLSSCWLIVIFILCWMPKLPVQEHKLFHIPNIDKLVHFTLFFVWAIFLYKDLQKKSILLILCAGLLIALLTEYLQPIVSNRTCDWHDGVADMTGLCLGLFYALKRRP